MWKITLPLTEMEEWTPPGTVDTTSPNEGEGVPSTSGSGALKCGRSQVPTVSPQVLPDTTNGTGILTYLGVVPWVSMGRHIFQSHGVYGTVGSQIHGTNIHLH